MAQEDPGAMRPAGWSRALMDDYPLSLKQRLIMKTFIRSGLHKRNAPVEKRWQFRVGSVDIPTSLMLRWWPCKDDAFGECIEHMILDYSDEPIFITLRKEPRWSVEIASELYHIPPLTSRRPLSVPYPVQFHMQRRYMPRGIAWRTAQWTLEDAERFIASAAHEFWENVRLSQKFE
jgi:hypothetical protein